MAGLLSIVRVRVVSEARNLERISARAAPAARAWARLVDAAFFAQGSQVIEAGVVEMHTAGARYFGRTLMGRLDPARRRDDLAPGRTIRLHQVPADTGIRRLEPGREYWVVVTPPLATHLIPMAIGRVGRTSIVFAAPCP